MKRVKGGTDAHMLTNDMKTSVLWDQLFKAPSIEQFFGKNKAALDLPPFCAYIRSLCEKRGEVPERVIKRANIERCFGHQIFRGDRRPSRDTVLQLAFGFESEMAQAQSLLKHAGYSALYPRVRREVIVGDCVLHKTQQDPAKLSRYVDTFAPD